MNHKKILKPPKFSPGKHQWNENYTSLSILKAIYDFGVLITCESIDLTWIVLLSGFYLCIIDLKHTADIFSSNAEMESINKKSISSLRFLCILDIPCDFCITNKLRILHLKSTLFGFNYGLSYRCFSYLLYCLHRWFLLTSNVVLILLGATNAYIHIQLVITSAFLIRFIVFVDRIGLIKRCVHWATACHIWL